MRVAILGNSGSGKSTLARQLALAVQAPVLDLDTVAWEPERIAVPRDAVAAARDVEAFCAANEHWVVEGCYANLVDSTFAFRPHLLFLDPGAEQCLANCKSRPWEPHKYSSPQEQDQRLQFLLAWVQEYYSRDGDMSHRGHLALFQAYAGPRQHIRKLPGAGFTLVST